MTHSGGKPHAVGDRGQRYQVTYLDPQKLERRVFGWSTQMEGAKAMAQSINLHPSMTNPLVLDRDTGEVFCL